MADLPGQALAVHYLGTARLATGDYPGAARDLQAALGISREIGDRIGQADALETLGVLREVTGDYLAAARVLEESLGIYHDIGDRIGQANALTFLGDARDLTGTTQARPGTCRRRCVSTATSATSSARPTPSTYLGAPAAGGLGDYPGAARGPAGGAGHLPRHRRPAR